MIERLYAPAQAQRYVAVGHLQALACGVQSSFLQELFLRSADGILRRLNGATADPDLLSLGEFTELELAQAIARPVAGEPLRVTVLRRSARSMRLRGLSNAKNTIRRRSARQRPLVTDPRGRDYDSLEQVENRLDCERLLDYATPSQRQVIELRMFGLDDTDIATLLGLSKANVAVLAHRGHNRIRAVAVPSNG